MSTSAASHLSPAYPQRAAYGTAQALRAWQQDALDAYLRATPRDFFAAATPGAGKTAFALRVAAELLARRTVEALTVVAPTEHLKHQWAEAAARIGIDLDPGFRNAHGTTSTDYTGVVLTYAQVAAHPVLHRRRTEGRRTLVVLDEIHHGGDALSWGDAIREAFEPATRRLLLTGTPFRSDTNPIPFVSYAPGADGVRRSVSDHSYGYGDALRDGVVRPVIFLSYSGEMRWRTRAGDEVSATLGEPLTRDVTSHAWRAALDPQGDWISQVLAAADRRLTEVRRHVSDAGGLVIASDQESARAYGALLRRLTGEPPVVVLSDDAGASARIEQFASGNQRWLVAVRMVSEGVDVPRLSVGVYATSASTPLYFAQAVGRFVRVRHRGETASVFLPSVPRLLGYAAEMEVERDHALSQPMPEDGSPFEVEDVLVREANRVESTPDAEPSAFETLGASARFDRVLYDGGEFGAGAEIGSPEEADFIGLPGLLEPDQVAQLLRRHQVEQAARSTDRRSAPPVSAHRALATLRRELNGLVAAWHHRTGMSHAEVHAALRRDCGGPPLAQASSEQVQQRIERLREWAVGRRS